MLHVRPILIASLWLVPAAVDARFPPEWGLDTLVVESDAIVLAERVGSRQVGGAGGPVTLTRYRLVKVYRGAHLPGEEVELWDRYPRKSSGWFGDDLPSFDSRVFIFLEDAGDVPWALRDLSSADRPRLAIVHSGLRLIAGEKVYGFIPGYMEPYALARRVCDKAGHRLTGDPLTAADFEEDVRVALARVRLFEQAKLLRDAERRREALLSLLAPYECEAEYGRDPDIGSFYGDALLQQMVDFLVAEGDMEGALEVLARVDREDIRLSKNQALDAAEDARLAPRLRAVAIDTLAWSLYHSEPKLSRVLALATAPSEPEAVRGAARRKLRWLRGGYSVCGEHEHTRTLIAFWERADEVLGLTGADGKSP